MKKQAISLLLALAMVVGIVLPAIPAVEAAGEHDHCVCNNNAPSTIPEGNPHDCENIAYTALTQDMVDAMEPEDPDASTIYYPISGNYYLAESVDASELLGRFRVVGDLNICLNGNTFTCQGFRFKTSGVTEYKVNISDCSANATGKLVATANQMFFNNSNSALPATINIWGGELSGVATGTQGIIFALGSVKSGSATVHNELNIYGGTIKGSTGDSTSSNPEGAALRLSSYTVCNMYGGVITGGTVKANASKNGRGGNIYMVNPETTFNMWGGLITGGQAIDEDLTDSKYAQGGNIYLSKGELNIYGGTISGGTCSDPANGGNIYVASNGTDAVVNFEGGKIISGQDGNTIVYQSKTLSLGITGMGLEIAENGSIGVGYSAEITNNGFDITTGNYGVKLYKTNGDAPEAYNPITTDKFVDGVAKYYARITEIMAEGADTNAANATTKVHGAAYCKIGNTIVESQESAFTLKSLVKSMDAAMEEGGSLAENTYIKTTMNEVYALYSDVMSTWGLTKIGQ